MPRHNFDSKLNEKHNFESKISDKHYFTSIINVAKYFIGIIDGAYFNSNSWGSISGTGPDGIPSIINFVNSINIAVGKIRSSMKIYVPMSVESIGFAVNDLLMGLQIKQRAAFISTSTISSVLKMRTRMGNANFQMSQAIQARMSQKLKIKSTSLRVPQVTIIASPTYRKYYKLSDWDSSNLSDLDAMNLHAMNLSAMDYQSV